MKKKSGRYDTSHLIENQYEPGSRGRVLRNFLHITRKRDMDLAEAEQYALAIPEIGGRFDQKHCFTAADICELHNVWLGDIYVWAGQYRQVNVSKGGFAFAAARYIPKLMQELEKGALRKYTPCTFNTDEEIIEALAVVHAELMLIHPFREGNGRAGRLFVVLMAFQAGLPGLDFSGIRGNKRQEYFTSVQESASRDYEPMKRIFSGVLSRTRRKLG